MPKKEKSDFKPASFRQLMRYATSFDWALLIGGLLISCVHGCLPSINMIIFRGITEVLVTGQAGYNNGTLNMDEFSKEMMLYVILYFVHGLVTFGIGYCSVGFIKLSENTFLDSDRLFLYTVRTTNFHDSQVFFVYRSWPRPTMVWEEQRWQTYTENDLVRSGLIVINYIIFSGIDTIRNGTSDKIAALIQAVVSLFAGLSVSIWLR